MLLVASNSWLIPLATPNPKIRERQHPVGIRMMLEGLDVAMYVSVVRDSADRAGWEYGSWRIDTFETSLELSET